MSTEQTMENLNCYFTTFNCGRKPLDIDHFASHLFDGLKTNLPPDVVVLSLQEIAPIGQSFIGGSLLTPYLTRFTTAVNTAAARHLESKDGYVEVIIRNVGMTAIAVYASPDISNQLQWIETAGVGVGVWEMGNKGAVAVRLALSLSGGGDDMVSTFVAAHLAPMEWSWERRNQDWRAICEGLVFERSNAAKNRTRKAAAAGTESEPLLSQSREAGDEKGSLFSPLSHLLVGGDLNYRTSDTGPAPNDYKTWPKPSETINDIREYSSLFTGDQLVREMQRGKTFHNLKEAEVKFPPTYKYSSAAQHDAALDIPERSHASETSSPWARHRVPSWCDRILYLEAAQPTVENYIALPVQPTSDHRPVAMSLSLPMKHFSTTTEIKSPFQVRSDWKEARAAARRYEMIVGIAAYLALTWEGEALLAGSVIGVIGGYLALRAILAS